MPRAQGLAPFLAAAFALAACSGGAKTPLPPSPNAQRLAGASFVIHWTAPHPLTHARRPLFISPSAQSVVVEVNNDPTLTTIVDRSSSSTSTVAFKAPPGDDTIVFSLWDAAGGSGTELGQATATANIVAGTANTVSATIDGIVSSVQVAALPNQMVAPATSGGSTTFAITGDLPQTFAATPLDADGNVIIADGNPITYNVKATSNFFTASQIAANGQFTVQVQQVFTGSPPPAFTVSALDGQGDLAQSNYGIATIPFVLIGYANAGTGTIAALLDDGTPVHLAGSFSGLTSPLGMMYAPDMHRLFVLDSSGSVLAYGSDGNAATGFTSPKVTGANGITYDAGNQWIYVSTPSSVAAFKAVDGSPVSLSGAFPGLVHAVGIAASPTAPSIQVTPSIEIVDAGTKHIVHFDEQGNPHKEGSFLHQSSFLNVSPIVPSAISGDDIGDQMIVGNNGTSDVFESTFNNTILTSTSQNLSGPDGIAFDPASRFFFVANATSGAVAAYDAFQATPVFQQSIAAPNGLSHPTSVTFVP